MPKPPQEEFLGTERFLVEKLLGTGTFGVVYQAYDKENNSVIALKKLRNVIYQQNSEALYRFKQEFRSLTDIIHPNLAILYELIFDNDHWFFTMELVEGVNFIDYVCGKEDKPNVISTLIKGNAKKTVQDALTTTIIPDDTILNTTLTSSQLNKAELVANHLSPKPNLEPEAIERLRLALRQLAEGIHTLHKAGKLHRDLKPSNVLVTSNGRVVILDFGLVIEHSVENLEIDLVGTPTHMSPEQAAGQGVTPASDWYSFGVILYQALTGKLPFSGKLFEVLSKKQISDPIAPDQIIEEIPSDLSEFCMTLLRRDPTTRPSGEEILLWLKNKLDSSPSKHFPSSKSIFVGRENSLDILEQGFLSTKTGTTNIAYVSGISGIGKTSLVKHFLSKIRQQDRDTLILLGRCYEQESMPYKVFDSLVDSLAQYLKHLTEFQLMRLLPLNFPALTRLFPVLKSVSNQYKHLKDTLNIPDTQELRRRAFSALRELLTKIAQKIPVVIFIDDLQWGDRDSAALLQEIFSPPNPPNLLLIASYRSEETENSLFLQALLNLQAETHINSWVVKVDKLSDEESRQLALNLLGENQEILSPFADLIAEEAIGIPFFINELVQHLPINNVIKPTTKTGNLFSSGRLGLNIGNNPTKTLTSLDKTIYERVCQLTDTAKRLLEVIAIASRPISRQIAKRVANLQQEELSAIATLRVQHLIRFRETSNKNDEIETYHDRIRETVVRHLSKEALEDYHNRLAKELEAISDIDPEILVVHFLQAGNQEKTAKYAFDAGEKASQTLAFDRASYFYQICLNLSENTSAVDLKNLHIKLATVLASAGRSAEAAYMFLQASENCSQEEWLDLQRRAGEQYLVAGLIDDGLSLFLTILHALGMVLPQTPKEALEAVIVLRKDIEAKGLVFTEKLEAELSTNERLQIDTCWSIVIGLTFIDTIKAAAFQEGHLLLALEAGEIYRLSRAILMEIGYRATAGHPSKNKIAELCAFSESLLEKVPTLNKPHSLGLHKLILSSVAYFYGEWKKIPPITTQADRIFREECTNVPWEIDASNLYLLRALYFMGEIKAISNRLPIILKEVEERGNLWVAALLKSRFYIIYLAEDKPEKAKELLDESISGWSNKSFYMQHYWNLFGNVEVLLYCQEGEKVWELINNSIEKLKESMLLRVQVFLLESLHLQARSALAISLKNSDAEKYLNIAKENAERIEEQEANWAMPLASLIYASIAIINNDKLNAISLLTKAQEELQAVDMNLYSHSALYRRGQLIGGQEGEALQKEAFNWMSSQNIKNPSRIVDMLIPGKL